MGDDSTQPVDSDTYRTLSVWLQPDGQKPDGACRMSCQYVLSRVNASTRGSQRYLNLVAFLTERQFESQLREILMPGQFILPVGLRRTAASLDTNCKPSRDLE